MKYLLILISVLSLTLSAEAQTRTSRVNARQVNQRSKIKEGRQQGDISNNEAAVLHAEQKNIRRTERRAKADGKVTPKEKHRLIKKQNRAARDILRARKIKSNSSEN